MPAYYSPFTLMPSSSLTKSTVVIMAIASGLAVGSNYLIQPLIVDISRYFSLSPAFAGYFVTLSQIAYALGLIFIVPLSDLLNNRRCVAVLFVCTALSMFLASLAPKLSVLLLGLAGLGLFCVAAMILVPYAATLAAPEVRSKTVGNVMTGLLAGILLARTISGAIAQYFGWRAVFFIIGLTMLIMAFVLLKALPDSKPSAKQSYFSILLSVWKLQLHDKVLRTRSILGAINFGLFSIFWTSITLLLSHTPYHYSVGTIGLFGLLGACGVLGANLTGRLAKRSRWTFITLTCTFGHILAWGFLFLGSTHLWALIIGIILLDFLASAVHICNQTIIYRLEDAPRGRITAGYMTLYFIGGVIGSSLSAYAYGVGGWKTVCFYGAICACVMFLIAIFTRRVTD